MKDDVQGGHDYNGRMELIRGSRCRQKVGTVDRRGSKPLCSRTGRQVHPRDLSGSGTGDGHRLAPMSMAPGLLLLTLSLIVVRASLALAMYPSKAWRCLTSCSR